MNSSIESVKKDGFLKLKTMKVPDFVDSLPARESFGGLSSTNNEDYCRQQCIENCSCTAYGPKWPTGPKIVSI